MTRDEAIEWLNRIEDKYIHGGDDDFDAKRKQALDIAIEALQTNIVRCKECRHAYYADNRVPHERTWVCERFTNEEINANDFCSFGERSEE